MQGRTRSNSTSPSVVDGAAASSPASTHASKRTRDDREEGGGGAGATGDDVALAMLAHIPGMANYRRDKRGRRCAVSEQGGAGGASDMADALAAVWGAGLGSISEAGVVPLSLPLEGGARAAPDGGGAAATTTVSGPREDASVFAPAASGWAAARASRGKVAVGTLAEA
jgi:hypothetical protein